MSKSLSYYILHSFDLINIRVPSMLQVYLYVL